MPIFLILGTRPQIIKSATLIDESLNRGLEIKIIHTGQHYDYNLSKIFLEEFSLPDPIINLDVGSGSHAFQTAEIMLRLEKYLFDNPPSLALIPGDTNSALAGALASIKLRIPIAHVEAGARCYDMKMAEEINRRLVDHCSEILFAPTFNCKRNLEKESVLGEIYLTGDTMYDVFIKFQDKVDKCDVLDRLDLDKKEYALLTLHRPENVDNPRELRDILQGIQDTRTKVIFPSHPRTSKRLKEYKISLDKNKIKIIDPINYIEMMKLLHHAKFIFTDSGGLQKEAFWSKTPCITIRDRTEWPETVERRVNILTGSDPKKIISAVGHIEEKYYEMKNKFNDNLFGDGNASKKIIEILIDKEENIRG